MKTLTLIHVKYTHKSKELCDITHESWVNAIYLNGLEKYPIYEIEEIETKEVSIIETWKSRLCSVSGQIFGLRTSCEMVGCKFSDGSIIF